MRYIWESGVKRRVMHIGQYDRLGNFRLQAICGRSKVAFNRSINAPFKLGKPVCKRCLASLEDQ